MMPFIVTHASLDSMMISATRHVQGTVLVTNVTEMVDVTVVLDMEDIHVSPVQISAVALDVMNN